MALDERLHRELERAARPADPSGIYEDLLRRRGRRQVVRRIERGLLAVGVIAGSIAGVYGLAKVFEANDPVGNEPPAPVPIVSDANGSLAFTTGDRIVIAAPDGSAQREVPAPEPGLAWHIAWSPDGTRLAVAIFQDPGRSLWVMNADGSDPVLIARTDNVHRPSWHPDGEHLTYSAENGGRTAVHVVRGDGSDDRVVYEESAPGTYAVFSSTFSPDGSLILFDAGTDSDYDIFVMDAEGSNVRPLTTTGTDYNPAWSPDGARIIFTRDDPEPGSDIFVMDSDGSSVERLTDDGPSTVNLDPQYSPDGTVITFSSATTGVTNGAGVVVAMAPDGSDRRTLVETDVLSFSWQPLPEDTSIVPSRSPSASPLPEGAQDIGMGFPVCFAERLGRIDYLGDGTDGNAWTAVPVKDDGTCPEHPAPDRYLLAVDHTGDEVADSWMDLPFECWNFCPPFDATDLDGNRTEELIVVNSFSIMDFSVFAVRPSENGDLRVEPILVAPPGHEPAGISAGEPLRIDAGGDAGYGSSIECEGYPSAPVIVWSWSYSEIDSDEPTEVHVTRIELQADGLFHVIDTNDFTVPAGVSTGIGGQYETGPQCGVDWWRL